VPPPPRRVGYARDAGMVSAFDLTLTKPEWALGLSLSTWSCAAATRYADWRE
jgi:hypothetical protein